MGLAEDTFCASIACRQSEPIAIRVRLKDCEEVYNMSAYLSYSDRMVEGSPTNSISTAPIMPWGK